MMTAPVRHLKDLTMKESAFEKPYLDEEYPRMHLLLPTPRWPNWSFDPRIIKIKPKKPVESYEEGCHYCILICYAPVDCEEPIECHPAVFCSHDQSGSDCEWHFGGGYLRTEVDNTWPFPAIKVWIDPAKVIPGTEISAVTITFIDGLGHSCWEEVQLECGDCCSDPETLTYPGIGTNPAVVNQGSTDTVYITGGCPPFSWSVSGVQGQTGFTINGGSSAQTTGRSATFGVGGSTRGTAEISITDVCGTNVVGYVRSNAGVWVNLSCVTTSCDNGSYITCSNADNPGNDYSYTYTRYRYQFWRGCHYSNQWNAGCRCSMTAFGITHTLVGATCQCGGGTCSKSNLCMGVDKCYEKEWQT